MVDVDFYPTREFCYRSFISSAPLPIRLLLVFNLCGCVTYTFMYQYCYNSCLLQQCGGR